MIIVRLELILQLAGLPNGKKFPLTYDSFIASSQATRWQSTHDTISHNLQALFIRWPRWKTPRDFAKRRVCCHMWHVAWKRPTALLIYAMQVSKNVLLHTHTHDTQHTTLPANIDRSQRYVELVNEYPPLLHRPQLPLSASKPWTTHVPSRISICRDFHWLCQQFLAEKPHKLPCKANKFAALFNAKCKFVTQKHG